ncbi:unnamed protein product, partial [Ixodes hexagonus]
MTGDEIKDEEYEKEKTAYKKYCKILGDYSDLYLKQDVLLLADVVENFRDVCLQTYELDACWYFTTQGLAWDAMLKVTKIRLEMIGYGCVLTLENGISGGMTDVTHIYAKANNKYLPDYDKAKP